MPIDLDERGNALENEYFHRQEKELLAKMKAKISSENKDSKRIKVHCEKENCQSNLKEIDFEGVKIDTCQDCGGVWLDGGELAQLMSKDEKKEGWFNRLFS